MRSTSNPFRSSATYFAAAALAAAFVVPIRAQQKELRFDLAAAGNEARRPSGASVLTVENLVKLECEFQLVPKQ